MPNNNQAAKSYIETAMARADINALAAKAQLEAVRTALGGYKDSDLASLATTLKARLDKAEKVCEAFHRCRVISRVTKDGSTVTAIEDQARVQELYEAYTAYRALLDERK